MSERIDTHIESLIFVAQAPVKREDIKYNLENALQVTIDQEQIDEALARLQEKYWDDNFAIEIVEVAEGFQFVTKGAYHHVAGAYLKQLTKRRLSKVALETLAIIAYRQPITKAGIEAVRGVSVDTMVQQLVDRGLVKIEGRADLPGRPLLYGTTEAFLDHFGVKSLDDMPNAQELRRVKLPTAEEGQAQNAEAPAEQLALAPVASEEAPAAAEEAPAGE